MQSSHLIRQGTAQNFTDLVLENSVKGPVLVDFWAPWVGPSRRQRDLFERLVSDYAGRFLLVTVNTDEEKALVRRFNIRSLPTARLFRNGEVVETFHGMQPEGDLRKVIDRHLVKRSDVLHAAGLRSYRRGEVEAALQQLADAAVADPANSLIPADIAKILLAQGRLDEAEKLLLALPADLRKDEAVDILLAHVGFLRAARDAPEVEELEAVVRANPDDLDARYRLASVGLVADDYDRALEQLLTILRHDRHYRDDIGRRGMLAVFDILGDDNPLVDRYRKLLFEVLH